MYRFNDGHWALVGDGGRLSIAGHVMLASIRAPLTVVLGRARRLPQTQTGAAVRRHDVTLEH